MKIGLQIIRNTNIQGENVDNSALMVVSDLGEKPEGAEFRKREHQGGCECLLIPSR